MDPPKGGRSTEGRDGAPGGGTPPTPPPEEKREGKPTEGQPPRDLSALPESIAAVVRDDATDAPIAGSRVLFAVPSEEFLTWWGSTTDAEGRFSFAPRELWGGRGDDPASTRIEIRVRAAGYADFRFDARQVRGDIRLTADPTPPLPGTVRGIASDNEGRPWSGRLAIEGHDQDFGLYLCQWCWSAEDGTYALPGLPAGSWKIGVRGGGKLQDVRIPEGGEVWVNLVVPAGGPGTDPQDAFGEALREVRVTGLPGDGGPGAILRCENRPRHGFREPVVEGACRFPAVPEAKWTLVLEIPGRPEARMPLEVAAGEGPILVDWKP